MRWPPVVCACDKEDPRRGKRWEPHRLALLSNMRTCGCLSFIVCTWVCVGIVTETDALTCCRSGRSIGSARPPRLLQMNAKGFGGSTSTSEGKASATRSGKAGGGGYAQSALRSSEPPVQRPLQSGNPSHGWIFEVIYIWTCHPRRQTCQTADRRLI